MRRGQSNGPAAPGTRRGFLTPHHALGMRPPVPESLLENPKITGTNWWLDNEDLARRPSAASHF